MMAQSVVDGNSLFNFVIREGNGVTGLVDLGLPKVPELFVQPPHVRIDEVPLAISDDRIPTVDLSKLDGPDHDQVVKAIARAAETRGFFQVVNHGVPVEVLESMKDAAHNFFRQPAEKKVIYRKGSSISPSVTYGTSYLPEREKSLEWKDYLSLIYHNDVDALENWPQECRDAALEYLKGSTKFVRKLLHILIGHLGVILDDSQIDALTGSRMVRVNYYPACPNPEVTIGCGCHSDLGILTVLLQDEIGGLHVKMEDEVDGKIKEDWIEIPPVPGALVINIGNTLQMLSNGHYKSAEHRVRTASTKSRVSIPIFFLAAQDEKIEPLPEVVAKDGVAHFKEFVMKDYIHHFMNSLREERKSLDIAWKSRS